MSSRKTPLSKSETNAGLLPGKDSQPGAPDLGEDTDLGVGPEEGFADSLADLFGPEDDGTVSLRLFRREPKYVDGQRIFGYAGQIPYGEDLDWVLENRGGGSYYVQQYVNRKYVQSRSLFIAGPPKVSPPFVGRGAAAPEKPAADPDQTAPVEDDIFWRNLRQTLVMRSILKSFETPSISDQLVGALLDRNNAPPQVDPAEAMLKTLETFGKMREAFSATEAPAAGGDGLLGIFNKALDIIPKLAAARAPRPQLHRPPPALPAPAPADITNQNPQPRPQESDQVSVFQIAQAAIGTTVQAYLEEPPFTADQTVEALRAIVPVSPALVESLQANKKALYDGALLTLHHEVDPDPVEDEKFRLFFEDVFCKLLANPNP